MSATSEKPMAMPSARVREVLGDFSVFLERRNPAVELHYELYDDVRTCERVLSVTALAFDGHVLKHELRRKVEQAASRKALYRQLDAVDRTLLHELSALEAKHGVSATPGRWC